MNIGFTGTQHGMTKEQKNELRCVLTLCRPYPHTGMGGLDLFALHGDCIGADAQFNEIATELQYTTKSFPASDVKPEKVAHCVVGTRHEPNLAIKRNHIIVDRSDMVIATPATFNEVLRSGTWATIRYARKQRKKLLIIWPDGTVKKERYND